MKRFILLPFLLVYVSSWGQIITINNPNPIIICPGSNLNLQFTYTGINAGNTFTIEISDPSGSFTSPIVSTTVAGNNATSTVLPVPNGATVSQSYLVRITSSDPVTSRQETLFIGVPTPYVIGSSFCENGYIQLIGGSGTNNHYYPQGYIFTWIRDNVDITSSNEATTYNQFMKNFGANASNAGEYKVIVSASESAGSCTVTSTGNTITMKPAPGPPTVSASPNPVVSGSTTVITAIGCTSRAFWFDKAVETTAMFAYLGMDSSSPYNYTSAEISQVKTYYVACQSAYPNSCYSTRTPITINVDATGAPNAPTLTSSENNICFVSGSQIILTASNCSGIVRWYNSPTSQNPLETDIGAPYEYSFSPSAQTYTYYADCRVNGVLSTSRSTINVVIKPIPTPPTLSPGSLFINSGSNISIYTSNCPGGIVKWYDSYQNGNLLFTGDTYSQNNVTTSLSLYASCTVNDCESSYRNSVSINVSTQVQAPNLYSASPTICGSGSKVIEAIGCSNGTVKWYDTYQNGNLLATGQTYTTPVLTYIVNGNNSYTYYADCTINGITSSSRSSVYISVYPASNTPTANNVTIACNATATLTASGCNSSSPNFESVRWYASLTAIDYLASSSSYMTPNLLSNTTYYVACRGAGNCESERVPVLVTVQCPQPPTISANPNVPVCAGININLSASGCSGGTVNWSDGGTGSSRTITATISLTLTATCTISGITGSQSNILSMTVNPKPNLVITNPASVSPPNTVNLMVPAVTAGSTLPPGTTLGYYSDAGVTTALNNPSAVSSSGTYYIKATSLAECIDIKPVVVTISNCSSPLTLVSTTDDYSSGTQLKKSNETITATNKLTGTANVVYRSGKAVIFNHGFKADSGTVFKAEIGGCD